MNSAEELQDVQGANDDIIPPNALFHFHETPQQIMTAQINDTAVANKKTDSVKLQKKVRDTDRARRDNAATRLDDVSTLTLPALHPSSKWLRDTMHNTVPINTSIRQMTLQSTQDGLYVLELFGGIGLVALRATLSAGFKIRCYTSIDKDTISQSIANEVLINGVSNAPTNDSHHCLQQAPATVKRVHQQPASWQPGHTAQWIY